MIWRRSRWNPCAEKALAGLIDPAIKSVLLAEIERGEASLWSIDAGGHRSWLVTRLEHYDNGDKELVLDAVQGRDVNAIIQVVKVWCKKRGVASIRFETHHSEAVAARLIRGSGFNRVATIFRCQVNE